MLLLLTTLLACGPKDTPPETITPPAPPEPEVVEEEVVEPEPEPEPVMAQPNVDFNVVLTFSDGSTKEGKVIRLERSSDFYGMKDWLDSESKLTIYGEADSSAKDVAWTDLKSASISAEENPSCIYESDWNPWLYVCTLKTNSTMVTKDGSKLSIDSKYKWRLTFEDESEVEFWLQNIRTMQQDDKEVVLGMDNYENHELYSQLQDGLRSMVYVKKVTIQ
jgi:hypothetical protein